MDEPGGRGFPPKPEDTFRKTEGQETRNTYVARTALGGDDAIDSEDGPVLPGAIRMSAHTRTHTTTRHAAQPVVPAKRTPSRACGELFHGGTSAAKRRVSLLAFIADRREAERATEHRIRAAGTLGRPKRWSYMVGSRQRTGT